MKIPIEIIKTVNKVVPYRIKRIIRRRFSTLDYELELRHEQNPYRNVPELKLHESRYPFTLGIIRDLSQYHANYIAACRELRVAYKTLDIFKSDWQKEFEICNCDIFLVWPEVTLTVWREMFDERLKILTEELNKEIFPSYKEIWFYENKRRVREWLVAHDIPHPRTWIFYKLEEAMEFLKTVNFPIVRKTALGAGSHGVKILYNRKEAEKDVKMAIKKGIVPERMDPRDKQWGYVILQEYIPHEYEWRIARIGDSFIFRKKIKRGAFASGSGVLVYEKPPIELLNFAKWVTDIGNFKSMAVDIFETKDGYLVNELQSLFGARPLPVTKETGRFIFKDGEWIFEHGDFYKNAAANLRVEYVIQQLQQKRKK